MKYDTLNALYWTCESGAANFHYLYAMNSRGWLPDPEAYSKKRREALEERGRASKPTPCEPDQPHIGPHPSSCLCVICHVTRWRLGYGPRVR